MDESAIAKQFEDRLASLGWSQESLTTRLHDAKQSKEKKEESSLWMYTDERPNLVLMPADSPETSLSWQKYNDNATIIRMERPNIQPFHEINFTRFLPDAPSQKLDIQALQKKGKDYKRRPNRYRGGTIRKTPQQVTNYLPCQFSIWTQKFMFCPRLPSLPMTPTWMHSPHI